MAPPASPEASEVRRRGQRRLIGAIAIVALLVVFVPMVLDSEPRPSTPSADTRIPPRDKAAPLPPPVAPSPAMQAATPKPSKLPDEPAKAPQAAPKDAAASAKDIAPAAAKEATTVATEAQHAIVEPVATVKKAEVLKQAADPKAAAPKTDKSEAPKAEAPKSDAKAGSPKLEGFALQVGAFRDEDKLRSAREKLAAAGVVHYTERLESPAGPITRLRAGPFPTRPAAEAAAAKLKAVAPDAKVVPLP